MSDKHFVEAAGFLLVTAGDAKQAAIRPKSFLLMRHQDRWDLPKGHRERGETLLQTALRETEEETGIESKSIELIDGFSFAIEYQVTYQSPIKRIFDKRTTYFLGRMLTCQDINCTEHENYRWFPWSPPHQIQSQTIDPFLAAVDSFLAAKNLTR